MNKISQQNTFEKRIIANPHVFIIIRAKIGYAKKAVEHMRKNDAQQKSLASSHPELYERTIHAESMAANIQGICAKLEGVLKSIANAMDGYTPGSDASDRDILMNLAVSTTEGRREIIKQGTLKGLLQLMSYRDNLLKSFAVKLGADEVFENVALMVKFTDHAFSEMEEFITLTEKRLANQD